MSSGILQPTSEISTHFRCHNCGILLYKVHWMRCRVCKAFDLCDQCAAKDYNTLSHVTRNDHENLHKRKGLPTGDAICFRRVTIMEADLHGNEARVEQKQMKYERILHKKKIENDYDMAIVMGRLLHNSPPDDSNVQSLVVNYYLEASERILRILSLDGGGVRGYLPIKIIEELIMQKNNCQLTDEEFLNAQREFTKNFDYFVGTSTGGLIAFCLAVNYNILDIEKIYSDSEKYFKKNRLGPVVFSKYDPSVIHNQIDEIIDQLKFPGKTFVSRASEHATLLDLRNLLNPDRIIREDEIEAAKATHGHLLEFIDGNKPEDTDDGSEENDLRGVPREKVLLITAYNTTANIITIFNTSYADHWDYRIADVLKATMAAPTYFPPQKVYRGTQTGGRFTPEDNPQIYVDGGIFANDPEVAALWAIRMQWKKPVNYNLLCIGTGSYTSTVSPSTWGGYLGWIFNQGFLVNTLLDATSSFTEIIGSSLATFRNMRRIKLNYQMTKAMALDDPEFIRVFDDEWEKYLKHGDDFNALLYFYDKYILKK